MQQTELRLTEKERKILELARTTKLGPVLDDLMSLPFGEVQVQIEDNKIQRWKIIISKK